MEKEKETVTEEFGDDVSTNEEIGKEEKKSEDGKTAELRPEEKGKKKRVNLTVIIAALALLCSVIAVLAATGIVDFNKLFSSFGKTDSQDSTTETCGTEDESDADNGTEAQSEEMTTVGEADEALQRLTENTERGTVDGNVYENTSVGLKFTKPENWKFLSDEEIEMYTQLNAEVLLGSEFEALMTQQVSFTDMMLIDSSTGTTVGVTFEDVDSTAVGKMTAEQYLMLVRTQLPVIDGVTYTQTGDISTLEFGEYEYKRMEYVMTFAGISNTIVVYAAKFENYVCAVSIATVSADISEIEAMFS